MIRLRRIPNGQSSFTLIELLVVTSILGLVIAAIAACIAGGLRTWDAARTVSRRETASMLAFAALDRDLGSSSPFYGIPFRGERDSLAFPCLVAPSEDNPAGIGEVRYSWDGLENRILRRERPFPGMDSARSEPEAVLSDVTAFAVEYGSVRTQGEGAFEWKAAWSDPTNHPHAVRIALRLDRGERTIEKTRTVWLPMGGEPYRR